MFKLVIFDLDDTLIDTWNATFPITLKLALKAMQKAGLTVGTLEELERTNATAKNTTEALTKFLKLHDIENEELVQAGKNAVYGYDYGETIKPLPGALELLESLNKQGVDLALVTRGDEARQMKSVKNAGIPLIFKTMHFVKDYDKTHVYQEILAETEHSPDETLVVGDRYATDLAPAKKLGTKVAWVQHGRGANFPPDAEPDYAVKELSKLNRIIT